MSNKILQSEIEKLKADLSIEIEKMKVEIERLRKELKKRKKYGLVWEEKRSYQNFTQFSLHCLYCPNLSN